MPRVVESMTRVELTDGRVVRVWRDETALPHETEADWIEIAYRNRLNLAGPIADLLANVPSNEVARRVATMKRVNAVEVLEKDGSGVLVYPEWP